MTLIVGPLLGEVLKAHADDDEVLSYQQIGSYAEALIAVCQDLHDPLIWPVGPAAERLAGAATLLGAGRVRVWDRHSTLEGAAVLLVALNLVGPLPIETELRAARAAGADRVHACAVAIPGVENVAGLDRYVSLRPSLAHRRSA